MTEPGLALKRLAALALALAGLAVYAFAGPVFHLQRVDVTGDSWAVTEADVRAGLSESGRMSLLTGDFGRLAEEVTGLALVRSASVSMDLPDALLLEVKAREPYARAADGGLVDSNGEWYGHESDLELPIFSMPPVLMPEAVAFHADAEATLRGSGLAITQLHHGWDGWRVFLGNGWVVLLGENKKRERLGRFASALADLRGVLLAERGLRFDMRYPHGLAIAGWAARETTGEEDG